MREFLNKYAIPIIAVIFILAAILAWRGLRPIPPITGNPTLAFYIDEQTGAESTGPATDLPPLPNKDGKPTIVRVIKYTCDNKKIEPLYYLKYSEETLQTIQSMPPPDLDNPAAPGNDRSQLLANGMLVRSPKPDGKWISANQLEAGDLMALPRCPDGKFARIVSPQK